jgi:hypothetical protein
MNFILHSRGGFVVFDADGCENAPAQGHALKRRGKLPDE